MNIEITLNSAFYGMEICGGNNVIDIGFINVLRYHCYCLNEYKKNTKYRFLRHEFSEDVIRQRF